MPLVSEDEYRVDAILSTSLSDAYNQFAQLKIQLVLVAIMSLVASILGAIFLSRNVTRPINELVTAAQRISSGDYSGDINFSDNKKDEVSVLAKTLYGMQQGIAEREGQILHQVYHDALTGLPNRTSVIKEIKQLSVICQKTEQSFAVMSLNINRFKQVNDTFGYQTGDALLKAFADRLATINGGKYFSARISGDEFIALIQNVTEESLPGVIESDIGQLCESYFVNDFKINITVRVGISVFPLHGNQTGELLRRSDIALNEAKENKSPYQFYIVGSDAKHLNRIRLINDLKQAIEHNHLVMYYQPKVDLNQQRVTQAEALIRWFHKDQGFVSPEDFIPLAEQAGLMPSLSRWVLRTVIKEVSGWHSRGIKLSVAINLSAYDLVYDDLPEFVNSLLKEFSLPASNLILEVTESAVMIDPDFAMSVLHRFKAAGIKLAIDDFGTGYSSLGQLKSMPVDELKIDKSFVLKLDQDKDDQVIVRSTIEMGHNIGLTIVAEGVETLGAWKLLAEYGCDKLQGYYISKPQSASDFLNWYEYYKVEDQV